MGGTFSESCYFFAHIFVSHFFQWKHSREKNRIFCKTVSVILFKIVFSIFVGKFGEERAISLPRDNFRDTLYRTAQSVLIAKLFDFAREGTEEVLQKCVLSLAKQTKPLADLIHEKCFHGHCCM